MVATIDELEPIEPPEDHECPEDAVVRGATGAAARGWGDGWPSDNSGKMRVVRAAGIALSVRAELAPLIEWLLVETQRRGYTLRPDECWGFANRPIRGTRRPSNHSWGLAVDLNSRSNPMGPTLVTDMPEWMVDLWTSHGFRWGGAYRGRRDAMHFEYMASAGDAARTIATLPTSVAEATGATTAVVATTAPLVSAAAATMPLLREGASGAAVRAVQQRLNAHGARLTVDGDFGPRTLAAVMAFQRFRGLAVDGIVGPATWRALHD